MFTFIFTPVRFTKQKPTTWGSTVLPLYCIKMSCFLHIKEVMINKCTILTRMEYEDFFVFSNPFQIHF